MVETVDDIERLNSVYLLVYLVQETSSKWLWLRNSGAIFTGQAKISQFLFLMTVALSHDNIASSNKPMWGKPLFRK
jgi:uncharacterized PurR-regulated membrane protein YhhQ (DUF165 family)